MRPNRLTTEEKTELFEPFADARANPVGGGLFIARARSSRFLFVFQPRRPSGLKNKKKRVGGPPSINGPPVTGFKALFLPATLPFPPFSPFPPVQKPAKPMKTKSFTPRTIGLTAAAVCLASLALVPTAQAQLQVTAQKIGRPIWKPLDFHLFGAQVGTPGDGFAELYANLQKVLPPPNHVLNPELGIGPGAAHPPPYDHEIANGIAAAGFLETTNFHNSDFNLPNGVWLFWMTVPA